MAATLYIAAERGRVREAVGIAAGLLAVSVAARLVEGDDAAIVLGLDLGSEAVLMLAVIALGDAVRSRRSLRAEMQLRAAGRPRSAVGRPLVRSTQNASALLASCTTPWDTPCR